MTPREHAPSPCATFGFGQAIKLARTEIVGQSDRTGYVAVARAKSITRNKDVTAIGRGKSQGEADANALKKLIDREATTDEVVVYRYFSYGDDSGTAPRVNRHARRTSKTKSARLTTS
jgi:hypothetical protein